MGMPLQMLHVLTHVCKNFNSKLNIVNLIWNLKSNKNRDLKIQSM